MSIRMVAQELYRLERRVTDLEKALAAQGSKMSPERSALELQLLQARKDRDHLRTVLKAKKEPPPWVS